MAAGAAFSLAFTRTLGAVVVHIRGPVDADAAAQLKSRLTDVIDGQGNRHVVVDLRGTTQIGGAGLSVLVDALKRMRRTGGRLVLSGSGSGVNESLRAAGLEKVFDMTPEWAHPARAERRSRWGGSVGSGDSA